MTVSKALALGFALSLPLMAPLAGTALAEGATVNVIGEVTLQATPDMATVMLGVSTDGETAAATLSANNAAVTAVLKRLADAGIEDRDLQTSNLSLNPNWVGYDSGSMPSIANYTAMNMLNVRVRDLSQLGMILDVSVMDGANTLNGITFELSDPRPVMDEARKAAFADAKARAELLVAAAGGKLGAIVSITETPNYASGSPMFRSDAAAASPVPVATGQIGMAASVSVTFELLQ